ncbi:S8 family serine peptidase [Candidatus Poriferisocius sp.]|uniref:S8 family peptidase n=1 Tax=Candidatus Poriferisocius sp. TaxID=3101276 RepID=UPI003B023E9E
MAQPVNDAADCAASFRFAEKPVPVVKTSDGQTVLASVEWGYSAEHNLCYLVLDNQAVTVLRAKRDEIIGTDPPQDAAAAARCHRAYNPQRGFAADPVPVVKTADGQTVLATVRWGYSSEHNLCYLVLDDQAITILQTAAAAVAQERYEERLAAAVETLDDGAVCPQADAPESFDGVAEVGRIQDGCVVLEYVALAGRTMADLRAELASDPTVFAVGFPVIDVVPLQTPSGLYDDPSLPQWHLETMGADKLWDPDGWDYTDDQGNKRRIPGWPAGAEVTVAVIDSGVDGGHRDLDANVLTTGHECNRIDEEGDHGHGTLVAGIIAAEQGNGVDVAGIAPKARILPIRIDRLDKNCKDDLFPTVTQAINDARTSGADIINISLHWPLEESDGTTRIILDCAPGPGGRTQRIPLGPSAYCVSTDTMWWAIRVARRQGVVTVAASGNCGDDHPEEWADPDGDGRRDWVRSADKDNPKGDYDKSEWKYAWENDGCDRHNQFDYPASYPETISVAAINADRQRRVSSTSNGSVDVAAPGGKILTTRSRLPRYEEAGGTVTRSGTSFAAPMVSAAIAHMKARYPQATPEQITTAILATAHQDPNANPRSFNTALLHLGFRTDDLGYGIINPIAAIEYLDRRLNHLPTPTTGNQFTAIATGSEHSCAIKTDKSIACWGSDNVHETAPPLGSSPPSPPVVSFRAPSKPTKASHAGAVTSLGWPMPPQASSPPSLNRAPSRPTRPSHAGAAT